MNVKATMVYSYITQDEDPVELEEGAPVVFIKDEVDGWAEVSVVNGKRKYVPKYYLQLTDEQVERKNNLETDSNYQYCHAVYDYLDGGEHDLKFNKGDLITVIEQNEDGWYVGQLENGNKGYFPTNYTDIWKSSKKDNEEVGGGNNEGKQHSNTGDVEYDWTAEENYYEPEAALPQSGGQDSPLSQSSHKREAKTGTEHPRSGSEELPTPPAKKKHKKMRKISLVDGVGSSNGNNNNNNSNKLQRAAILKELRRKSQNRQNRGSGSRTPTFDPPSRPPPGGRRRMHDRRSKSSIPAVMKLKRVDDDDDENERKKNEQLMNEKRKSRKKDSRKRRMEQRRRTSEQLRQVNIFEDNDFDDEDNIGGVGGGPKKKKKPPGVRGRRSGSGMLVDVLEIPNREIKKCRNEKGEIVVIGEGSFGKVFQCLWHRGLDDPVEVAVKVVPLKVARETLEKEVLTVKLLNHPTVVNVFGFSYLSSRKFGIVMEYVNGGTLFDLAQGNLKKFDNREPLSLYDKWSACRKMTDAVRFLHSRRVIHRDIKSLNFLVTRDRERIKICDFGLVKIKTESKTVDLKTGLKGTVRYMAPELSEENPKYGIKSDIFSLGMCFFEVCTGKIPYENQTNEIQVLMLIMKGVVPEIPPNTFVPDELKCLIELCLKKDPEERPTTEDILKFMKDRDHIFLRNYPPPLKKTGRSSSIGNSSSSSDQFVRELEEVFTCPLSRKVMEDPYLLVESGVSFEKEDIEIYLERNSKDPLSGKKLQTKLVIPNVTLKRAIELWNESR